MPMAAAAGALILIAVAASSVTAFIDLSGAPSSGRTDVPAAQEDGLAVMEGGVVASDLSGIPDSLQNFLYGTDPQRWNTSGTQLPDGWLIRYGYDALDRAIDHQTAATPPREALPAAYGGQWPARFTPTLWEVYAHDRPGDWDETVQGPFDNGLDPREWDNSRDGIPDGWLLHYGLDPRDARIGEEALAGADGLTVQEAFRHNTDPTRLDSDGDGIPDREELLGPQNPRTGERFVPSDPSAYSTAGSGVCDGYLVAFGLDPSESGNGYRDLVHSGVSTVQKFNWSIGRFGDAVCDGGRGLDPTRVSTLGGPIPDGWLLRYGLDPLDPDVADQVTQSSQDPTDAPWEDRTEAPEGLEEIPHVTLTVWDEYVHGRPTDWNETVQGPWGGGTDPTDPDSDDDGLPDAVEIRGYYVAVALDVGPGPDDGLRARQYYRTASDPTRADTSGDGLTDYEGVVEHGTDPIKRDTDLDGIPDSVEVSLGLGLDSTRADSAGDHLLDGRRLDVLRVRSDQYRQDPTYGFPGEPGAVRKVTDWACTLEGVLEHLGGGGCVLDPADLAHLFGPSGDLDGDGDPNILDPDADGDGLLNGWEVDPIRYGSSPFGAGPSPRPATDPLNPDTDGDALRDGWEVEHGRSATIHGKDRYDLDPSAWDSHCNPQVGDTGCDPVSDAERDDDEDGTAWVLYVKRDGKVVREDQWFGFPNLLEQQFEDLGADPNDPTSSGDGLLDGWKVFWGVLYPRAIDDRGLHYPGAPGDFQVPTDVPAPELGVDQTGVVIAEGEYTRFSFVDDPGGGETKTGDLDFSDDTTIHRFDGTTVFTFEDAQAFGTNPYMASSGTSGDGVPDWWKWHHQTPPGHCDGTGSPDYGRTDAPDTLDPLDPDIGAEAGLADDGLTVWENYQLGTNPWCASTTLTGVKDRLMAGLQPGDTIQDEHRENALDLSRVSAVLDAQTDSDRDGLSDFDEIIGFDHPGLGVTVQGTDPKNPDTDGDGLLDGGDVCLVSDSTNETWIALLLDLGVSYRNETEGGGPVEFCFQGEVGNSTTTHPLVPDDTGTGIPAGWLVSHDPFNVGDSEWKRYSFGIPAWWDATVHGPWWGGLAPDSPIGSNLESDPDLDGLRDSEDGDGYEDPMPGANWGNAWRDIDWNDYPLQDLDVGDPGGPVEPTDDAAHPLLRRLAAQSYLDPRDVGEKFVSYPRLEVSLPSDRDQPCIEYDGLRDGSGASIDRLVKGETAFVKGRVLDGCPSGVPLSNVTIEARMGGQSFGASFTDATGDFSIPINVTTHHRVTLPDAPPGGPLVVLRGRTSGVVEWTSDPSPVEPGPNVPLVLRTYANETLARSSNSDNSVKVEADSRLTLTAPEGVPTGPDLSVKYCLLDSSGTPLRDPVVFHWNGSTDEIEGTPGGDGCGRVKVPTPHDLAGLQLLRAHSEPTSGFVTAAAASRPISLRNPVDVSLHPLPDQVDANSTLDIRGDVSFQSQGVPGVSVRIALMQDGTDVGEVTVNTTGGGAFEAVLGVPHNRSNGEHILVATAQQTPHTVERQTSEAMIVRSIPRFTEVSTGNITQGLPVTVTGRLVEPDGSAVADVMVQVTLHEAPQTVTTDAAGRFSVTLDPALPALPAEQVLEFGGGGLNAPATHRVERAVLAPTTLSMASGELARGGDLDLPLRLTDATGAPVGGAPVWITWGDVPPTLSLTNATGHALFHRPGSSEDPIGPVVVHAEYEGTRGGGYNASTASAVWNILTKAEIVLPEGPYEAGRTIPQAVLRDAGTKQPLARQAVEHGTSPGGTGGTAVPPLNETVTDADGRFQVLGVFDPADPPQKIRLVARFAGDDAYDPVVAWSNVTIQTPVSLDPRLPPGIVLGRETPLRVGVQGMDDQTVDDGTVTAVLGNVTVGSAPVEDGIAHLEAVFPNSTAPGIAAPRFHFGDSQWYAPATAEGTTQLLRGVTLSLEIRPAEAGKTAVVSVRATSGGQPVPFASINLGVEGLEGGLRGSTDETGVATFRLEQPPEEAVLAARYMGGEVLNPAHATGSLSPVPPLTPLERGVAVFTWVAVAAAAALTILLPYVYRLRMSPLEPVFRRARRVLAGRGPDERRILQVYLDLEEAAIGQGILMDTAPTARTLQEAIAPRIPAGAHPSLDRLMDLFETARYGAETLGPTHRREATTALDRIIGALRAKAGGFRWRRSRKAGGVTA